MRPCCRAAVLSCGRAAVRPCCRAAVPHCCRAAGQPCGREAVHPTAEARHSLQQNEGLLWWWRWWRRRCSRLRAGQAARLPACAAAAAAARAVVVNGAPGAIASSAIDLGAAAAVRCSARRPPDRSKAAESRPYGLCADRPYRAPRSALPGITRTTSLQGGAGKQRAAIAGTKSKESRANACHRSSHRVENLAVSLRPREQASPLGADTHIAAIATHTSRQITFKY